MKRLLLVWLISTAIVACAQTHTSGGNAAGTGTPNQITVTGGVIGLANPLVIPGDATVTGSLNSGAGLASDGTTLPGGCAKLSAGVYTKCLAADPVTTPVYLVSSTAGEYGAGTGGLIRLTSIGVGDAAFDATAVVADGFAVKSSTVDGKFGYVAACPTNGAPIIGQVVSGGAGSNSYPVQLGVTCGGTAYTLPAAGTTTLGGVKQAAACSGARPHVNGIAVDGELTCSADTGGGVTVNRWAPFGYGATSQSPQVNANRASIYLFVPTVNVTASAVLFTVRTVDATNNTDIGVYGPDCAAGGSCSLIKHTGGTTYAATGPVVTAWTGGGSTTLLAGHTYILSICSNAMTIMINGVGNTQILPYSVADFGSATCTTGVLPATQTVPSAGSISGGQSMPTVTFQ